MLQLLQSLALSTEQADYEITNTFWDVVAYLDEGLRRLGSNQDTLTGRQAMADDISDGVSLTGPWRTLDYHPVRYLKPLYDSDLLVVKWLWEKEILGCVPIPPLRFGLLILIFESLNLQCRARAVECVSSPEGSVTSRVDDLGSSSALSTAFLSRSRSPRSTLLDRWRAKIAQVSLTTRFSDAVCTVRSVMSRA